MSDKFDISTLLLLGVGGVLLYTLYARLNPGVEYPLGYIEQQDRITKAYPAKIIDCDGLCFFNPNGQKCRLCKAKAKAIITNNTMRSLGEVLHTVPPGAVEPGSDPLLPRRGYNEACEYNKDGTVKRCKRFPISGEALEYPDLRQDETQFHVSSSRSLDPAESDRNESDLKDENTPQAAFTRAYAAGYGRDFFS